MSAGGDPAGLRRGYERGQLDEASLAPTWLEQLRRWFADAVADPDVIEPNAMQLATVDRHGHPSVRTVLLKGLDEGGLVFYTNHDSAKGADMAAQPYASAVLLWAPQERQVRVSGAVAQVDPERTRAYFAGRPRGSQLGAWASPQSQVIASRAELERALAEVEQRFAGVEVPVPPNWGGWCIAPQSVEFWQGRADRLHDRLRFRRGDTGWLVERLAP
jgi:pyridoxamine 5'-phosphate oxidase